MQPWPVTIALPDGIALGGVSTWALRLARRLAEGGRDVRLVVHGQTDMTEAQRQRAQLAAAGVALHLLPPLRDEQRWPECVQAYRALLPTVLLPNLWAESYALAAAVATTHADRVRVVGWNHSDLAYMHAALTYYAPIIAHFVPVSRVCEEQLQQRLPERAEDMTWLPYGVDVPPPVERAPLAGRPIRLVYAGRMEQENKRVLDLVDLAWLLGERGVRFELRFVGGGPDEAALKQKIGQVDAGVGGRIWLDPPVAYERMAEVWAWADVSLLASRYEGFSISMVESMAAGCTPVVSRVRSGVSDIVSDGQTGLTFEVDNLTEAADHIADLARDPLELARLSQNARAASERMCGYEGYLARVLSVLDGVVEQPPRWWPPAQPLHMNTPDEFGQMALPAGAATRLRALLQQLAEQGVGPIAIYGAGNHTRALAQVWAQSPTPIVAVCDDNATDPPVRLWGWPVVRPERVAEMGVRAIVISSWMHEEEIVARREAEFAAMGVATHRLYEAAVASASA